MARRKINAEELQKILMLHKRWLIDNYKGERADLQYVDLQGVDLRYANLRGADLRHADLRGADIRLANLRDADFRGTICDTNIQNASCLVDSLWLRSDVPWWLGHEDQDLIILCCT